MLLQVATEIGTRFAVVLEGVETYDQIVSLRRKIEELLSPNTQYGVIDPSGYDSVVELLHDLELTPNQAKRMQEAVFSGTPNIVLDSAEL